MLHPWPVDNVSVPEKKMHRLVIGFGDLWGPSGDLWGPSGTSGDHLGTIWEMDSMKLSVSLRLRRFRSARTDPSRLPSTAGARIKKSCREKEKKQKENKTKNKRLKTAKMGIA